MNMKLDPTGKTKTPNRLNYTLGTGLFDLAALAYFNIATHVVNAFTIDHVKWVRGRSPQGINENNFLFTGWSRLDPQTISGSNLQDKQGGAAERNCLSAYAVQSCSGAG